jgi:hypothetical protein
MLLTLILMGIPILYAIAAIQPSTVCGPYRQIYPRKAGRTPATSPIFKYDVGEGAFSVISKAIDSIPSASARNSLKLLDSIVVIGPILTFFMYVGFFINI